MFRKFDTNPRIGMRLISTSEVKTYKSKNPITLKMVTQNTDTE
jgi:hypothetical protein